MKLVALSVMATLAFTGAPAFGQTVMLNYSFPEMRAQLTELKATPGEEKDTDNKTHYLSAKTESGLNFTIYGQECDSKEATQRCRGAELAATFDLADQDAVEEAMALVDYAAVADQEAGENQLRLSRYLIFDEGITPGNLRTNLKVFITIADKVWDLLEEEDLF